MSYAELEQKYPWLQLEYGFECGAGWTDLLGELCQAIQETNPPPTFKVVQVKEKFGGLRFYCDNETEAIESLVYDAERESFLTCEVCGSRDGVACGAMDGRRWVRSLCEKCRNGG